MDMSTLSPVSCSLADTSFGSLLPPIHPAA
ncbi:MAG: hypothetical protein QOI10_2834 [Solirubrobacterales bacterium]|jgi:hypothetical protein|nr:hypothetical protein [Solirubrobacterales bacterium]